MGWDYFGARWDYQHVVLQYVTADAVYTSTWSFHSLPESTREQQPVSGCVMCLEEQGEPLLNGHRHHNSERNLHIH